MYIGFCLFHAQAKTKANKLANFIFGEDVRNGQLVGYEKYFSVAYNWAKRVSLGSQSVSLWHILTTEHILTNFGQAENIFSIQLNF